ncbi:MAG: hypothetical protein ACOYXB_11060 [Bacteroidota bacterium]
MKGLILNSFLLFTTVLNAQENLWFEAGPEADFAGFRTLDSHTYLLNGRREGANFSFRLRREISGIFSLETGINRGYYNEVMAVSTERFWFSGPGSMYFQIPFSLYAQKTLRPDRVFAFATLGLQYTIDRFYGGGITSCTHISTATKMTIECNKILKESYLLFQGSAGVRFRLFDQLFLSLSAGMNRSFIPLREYSIEYVDAGGRSYSRTETMATGYFNISLSVSCPLNRASSLAGKVSKNRG